VQKEGDERNVDALLRTPKSSKGYINVFRMFNWVMEEGWPCIPRKWSKEDATKEVSSGNIVNEVSRRKSFKIFFQSPECIKTNIFLKLPPTIAALIMNVPPIMAVPLANVLRIQLPKYHDNGELVLHIQQLMKVCVINGENTDCHKLQYFLNSLRGRVVDWFGKYETVIQQ
jgi:hypothetical protein